METQLTGLPAGLDPQVGPILGFIAANHPGSLREAGPERARESLERGVLLDRPVPESVDVASDAIALPDRRIEVRTYTPPSARGTVLFFHGGGWVLGSLDTHHSLCGRLAAEAGAAVVSVGYRVAPEAPFPAAVDDALAALEWIGERLDAIGGEGSGLAVAGDSAGGNLAAVLAQQARGRVRERLRLQLLIYPVTDVHDAALTYASAQENATGMFLTLEDMVWFSDQYQPDPESPLASPARAESLEGLPPALIITAQYDPLRDDGERYAELLRAAGVNVRLHRYDGQIHGFMSMSAFVDAANTAMQEVAAAVRAAVA